MTTISLDLSAIADGDVINPSDVITPLNQLKTAVEQTLDGQYDFLKTMFVDAITVTVASDAITVTQTRHRVENQGSASTDELATISGTVDVLLLQMASSGQTLTIKHNTGNIWIVDERDYALNNQNQIVTLYWNAQVSKWLAVVQTLGELWMRTRGSLTIASGAVTITQNNVTVVPESGTVDDLTTINNPRGLAFVVLTASSSHTITLKHGTGNLWFPNLKDMVLSPNSHALLLVWNTLIGGGQWTAVGIDNTTADLQDATAQVTNTFDRLVLPLHIMRSLGSGDVALDVFPRPMYRQAYVDQTAGGANYATFGGVAANVGSAPANDGDSDSDFIKHTTTTTTTNIAGRRSSNGAFQWRWSPVFEAVVKFKDSVQDRGLFLGFLAGTPSYSGGVTFTGVSGVFLSYAVAGGIWAWGIYNNGTALSTASLGVQTLSTGSTLYRVRLWVEASTGTVRAQINSNAIQSVTVTPAALATVGLDAAALVISGGVARSINISRIYGEQS